MSFAFDGLNKLIVVSGTSLDVLDMYSRYKDWVIAGNTQWLPAFSITPGAAPDTSTHRVLGGDEIDAGAGTSIPPYTYLTNGWRVRPEESDHTLAVTAGILLVQGGGDPFVDTLGAFTVRINYQQPVQAITVATGGAGSPAAIAAAVWDELLTGATHNIQNSAGKRLRDLASQVVHSDTAQGPAVNGNQIQLALAASTTDGAYDPSLIFISDGTGAGQSRNILQYEGSTRIATVDRNWKVNPDMTSEYVVLANAGREHVNEGLAQGGTSNTITLNTLASGQDDVYLHQTVFIRSGLGDDQVGIIIAYNGTTKVATIDGSWAVVPDSTSAYVMLPSHNNVATEQFAAYGGAITIDVANGVAGTSYPVGTALLPVNNLADAKTLGLNFGIPLMHVNDVLICGGSDVVDGLVFEGSNSLTDVVVLTPGCSTRNTVFSGLTLTGTVDGGIFAEKCALASLLLIGSDDDPSLLFECILIEGTSSFRAGLTTPQNIQLVNCVSGVTSGTGTTLDFNGSTSRVAVRKHSGALAVVNYTGAQTSTFEFSEGAVDFDATNTSGTAVLRGGYSLTDDSGVGFIILQDDPDVSASLVGSYRTSKVGEAYYDVLTVFDGLTPVTGELPGDFTLSFTLDGVVTAVSASIAEVGASGDYLITVPGGFPSKGLWAVTTVVAYNGSTWRSYVEVRTYDIDDVYYVVAGGSGVETVNLTFEDNLNGNIPIPDMLVNIYDAGGTVLITFGRTDNSGVLTVMLNAATYILRMFKPGVSCNEETLVVADTGGMTAQDFTLECSAVIVAPPSAPNVCRLFADFLTMAGLPMASFKLHVENLYNPEASSGMAVAERSMTYLTDQNGHVEFDIVYGTRVRVSFVTTKLTRELIVPEKSVESLMTVFGVATDAFQIVKR